TDSRGNNAYNEALSERRAQATLRWLINKGIDASRLTAKGYGENQLVNNCADGVACTEEEHQLNRRSMFIIVN
ncbi:MAG: OmpA family protein, partial [Marinirhabdus sp.]|nr:OmpA family protein [Marinirhabdus sp.]